MPTQAAGGAFRYPSRIDDLVGPFWKAVLATIESVHNAGDTEADSPHTQIAAELDTPLTLLLAYLEDRDRAIEDAVTEPFATRVRWLVD